MNNSYKKAVEHKLKMNLPMNDLYGFFAQSYVEHQFKNKYHAELTAAYKQLYPRRKKIVLSNLPPEIIEPIKQKWQEIALKWFKHKQKQYKLLCDYIYKNASRIDLAAVSDKHILADSSPGTYSTQTQPDYYAIKKLEMYFHVLDGYDPEIIKENDPYHEYKLIAYCEPYQFEALKILRHKDFAAVAESLNVNPRVYNPWL